jgi:hypothetical protein
LRKIELEIKSNKLERFCTQKYAGTSLKSNLVKKRKERGQFYEEISSNKQLITEICQKQLETEIGHYLKELSVWNPLMATE